MSKIFISHSSKNNIQAAALKYWLKDQGWEDAFLDVSVDKGLSPGEQWKNALSKAADRCEAVICLLSNEWVVSHECKVEYRHAEYLGKNIFIVFIEPCNDKDLTSSWQRCELFGNGEMETIRFELDNKVEEVQYLSKGLKKLKQGLKKVGLEANHFNYDISRTPYPGFRALDFEDAAIFFGRDAALNRALANLRTLRERGVEQMFVILGASGAGKSSFLRAGLLPRLVRDDCNFVTLPVIRPESAVITGKNGLIASLEKAYLSFKQPKNRADIKKSLESTADFQDTLYELQKFAVARLSESNSIPPMLILPIDQAEELYNIDGQQEVGKFIALITHLFEITGESDKQATDKRPRLFVIITIRSDSYPRFQNDNKLNIIKPYLFSLPPIERAEYKDIIEKPAARRTDAGLPLIIDPALTEQLLKDTEGADALPLLAFTLERLFYDYGSDNNLSLNDYETLGGLEGSITAAISEALANPQLVPVIPADSHQQNELLRQAFIPWLAFIDPDTEELKRRVARWDEIPVIAQPVIERLIQQRLLVRDFRKVLGSSVDTVVLEVAHEALLRRWSLLSNWLDEDAGAIKTLYSAKRSADEWHRNGNREDWLIHDGERLSLLEGLLNRIEFYRLLEEQGRSYVRACRKYEDELKAEQQELKQRKIKAEQLAEQERIMRAEAETASAKRLYKRTLSGTIVAAIFAVAAGVFGMYANKQKTSALKALGSASFMQAKSYLQNQERAEAMAYLAKAIRLDNNEPFWQKSLSSILLNNAWCPLKSVLRANELNGAHFSGDGDKIVILAGDQALLMHSSNGSRIGSALRHTNTINSAEFSPDGKHIVTASKDRRVRIWDSSNGKLQTELPRHQSSVLFASFTDNQERIVTRTATELRIFDSNTGAEISSAFALDYPTKNDDAYSEENYSLYRAKDNTLNIWDNEQKKPVVSAISGVGRVKTWVLSKDVQRLAIIYDNEQGVVNLKTGKQSYLPKDLHIVALANHDANALTGEVHDANINAQIIDIESGKIIDKLQILAQLVNSKDTCWKNLEPEKVAVINKLVSQYHLNKKTADSFVFSNDCNLFAGPIGFKKIKLWGAQKNNLSSESLIHADNVQSVNFSPDGKQLLTVTANEAHLWKTMVSKAESFLLDYGTNDPILGISSAGDRVLTKSDSIIRLRDLQTGIVVGNAINFEMYRDNFKFSDNGAYLLTINEDIQINLFETKGFTLSKSFKIPDLSSDPFLLSYDGSILVYWEGRAAKLLKTQTGKIIGEPLNHKTYISSVTFSRDGQLILTISGEDPKLWSTSDASLIGQLKSKTGNPVSFGAFDDTGKHIVTITDKPIQVGKKSEYKPRIVQIWKTDNFRPINPVLEFDQDVKSVELSQNGKFLLVLFENGTANIFDFKTNAQIGGQLDNSEKINHEETKVINNSNNNATDLNDKLSTNFSSENENAIFAAKFNHEGSLVVTASEHRIKYWDAETAASIGEVINTEESLTEVHFIANDKQLLTQTKTLQESESEQVYKYWLWDVPYAGSEEDTELLAATAELLGGYSISTLGALEPVKNRNEEIIKLKQNISQVMQDESQVRKAVRWLLSSPENRTVSPSAPIHVDNVQLSEPEKSQQ
jgi:WD40 repeat protein